MIKKFTIWSILACMVGLTCWANASEPASPHSFYLQLSATDHAGVLVDDLSLDSTAGYRVSFEIAQVSPTGKYDFLVAMSATNMDNREGVIIQYYPDAIRFWLKEEDSGWSSGGAGQAPPQLKVGDQVTIDVFNGTNVRLYRNDEVLGTWDMGSDYFSGGTLPDGSVGFQLGSAGDGPFGVSNLLITDLDYTVTHWADDFKDLETLDRYVEIGDATVAFIVDYVFSAWNPSPADGARQVSEDVVLRWNRGMDPNNVPIADIDGYYLSYIVYDIWDAPTEPNRLDTGWVDVIVEDPGDVVYYPATDSLPIGMNKRVFWSVDQRVDGSAPSDPDTILGPIWSFTTRQTVPSITKHPTGQNVFAGETAEFSVEFDIGAGDPEGVWYQWYKDGAALVDSPGKIQGAAGPTLTIFDVDIADEGAYYCRVENEAGFEDSQAALLTVHRLLAHWPLDGDIQSVVEGSPETFVYGDDPNLVAGVPGLYDTALRSFGNTGLYTSMDDAAYFDSMNTSLTVSMWMKSDAPGDWRSLVSRFGWPGGGWGWAVWFADQMFFAMRGTTGNDDQPIIGGNPFDGQWNHFAATWDGAEKRVYVNGELRGSQADFGVITSTPASVALYSRMTPEGEVVEFTNVALSDVKLYNYARTAEQIAQEYLSVTGGEWICNPDLPLQSDLTGDCRVGLEDFAIMALQWLENNRIYAP